MRGTAPEAEEQGCAFWLLHTSCLWRLVRAERKRKVVGDEQTVQNYQFPHKNSLSNYQIWKNLPPIADNPPNQMTFPVIKASISSL